MWLLCCDYCCSFFLFDSIYNILISQFLFIKDICFRHFFKVKKNALFRDHVCPPSCPSVCLCLTYQQISNSTYFHEIRYGNSSRKFRLSLSSVKAPWESYFTEGRKLISACIVFALQPFCCRDLTSCLWANMSCMNLWSERHALGKGINKLGRFDIAENSFD
jgi:hypothetical protein